MKRIIVWVSLSLEREREKERKVFHEKFRKIGIIHEEERKRDRWKERK